ERLVNAREFQSQMMNEVNVRSRVNGDGTVKLNQRKDFHKVKMKNGKTEVLSLKEIKEAIENDKVSSGDKVISFMRVFPNLLSETIEIGETPVGKSRQDMINQLFTFMERTGFEVSTLEAY